MSGNRLAFSHFPFAGWIFACLIRLWAQFRSIFKKLNTADLIKFKREGLIDWLSKIQDAEEDFDARTNALYSIAALKEEAISAEPVLLNLALKDPDWEIRNLSAYVLSQLGEASKQSLPYLIQLTLNGSDSRLQKNALDTIIEMKNCTRDAASLLMRELKSDNLFTRTQAAHALGKIGEDAKDSIPSLIQTLEKDKDFIVRAKAAFALGEMGRYAKEAVPALMMAAFLDQSPAVRTTAANILANMGEFAQLRSNENLRAD
jgi:HEAT repeat protein